MRAALILAALLICPAAAAQECPLIAGGTPALQAISPQARLEFVRQSLLEDEGHSKPWFIGWVTFLTAAEAFQIVVASVGTVVASPPPAAEYNFGRWLLTLARDNTEAFWIGSVSTLLGILSLTMTQSHAAFAGTAFDLHLKAEPHLDPCIALAEGERLLLRDAADEKGQHSALAHILNVAVNVASSLILWLVYHQWVQGAVGLPLGVGIGEALILTQPTTAEKALAQYQSGNLSPSSGPVAFGWGLSGGLRF